MTSNNKSILFHIKDALERTPSADNIQPWLINWQENKLSINYDKARVSKLTFAKDSPATLLTMGAMLENIQQMAGALDQNLKINIPKSLSTPENPYFEVEINSSNTIVNLDSSNLPIFKRHTNRLPYKADKIPNSILNQIEEFSNSSVGVKVYSDSEGSTQLSNLVRLASEIRFQTQEIHEWLIKSLRFSTEENFNSVNKRRQAHSTCADGLDVKTLNLPPGGTYLLRLISKWWRMKFLNYFGFYKLFAKIESLPIAEAPAVIGIFAKPSYDNLITAGQIMNRLWIYLNSQGIAVQPYFVISDQLNRLKSNTIPPELLEDAKALAQFANDFFKFKNDETLQILFRIGYPTIQPTRSKRLTISI